MKNKKQFTFGVSGTGDVFIKHHLPAIEKINGIILETCHTDAGFKKMIGNPAIDVVVIASPNYKHVDQAIAALDANKRVILEKPIGINVKDAERLLAHPLADTICVVYQRRYNTECQQIKDIGKDIKEIIAYVNVRRDNPYWATWRSDKSKSGGGEVINIAVHYLDLLIWWLGPKYTIEFAQTSRLDKYDIDASVVAILDFNGVKVKFTSSTTYDKRDIVMCAYTDLKMFMYVNDDATHFEVYDNFLNKGKFVTPREAFDSLKLVMDIYEAAKKR